MKSIVLVALYLCLGCPLQAQTKPKTGKGAEKPPIASVAKDTARISIADTLVSRLSMIQILRGQQEQLKVNTERLLMQIQGQIEAFEALTADSVRVKKSTFGGGQ